MTIICRMTLDDLRRRLQDANLSALSRASGVHIRTLRRIKHGRSINIMVSTVEALEPHIGFSFTNNWKTKRKKNA